MFNRVAVQYGSVIAVIRETVQMTLDCGIRCKHKLYLSSACISIKSSGIVSPNDQDLALDFKSLIFRESQGNISFITYLNKQFEPPQDSYLPLYPILEFSAQLQSHYIFVFIFGFIAANRWLNDRTGLLFPKCHLLNPPRLLNFRPKPLYPNEYL
jgi:hypothetical protein